ncbi:MAG TPA: N-acetylmuramoyl-L-alanine amidase [Paracoccus sp. (in: a-proteobacteria)]|nr:N-acetylmuramoyl-L-alanine amidase [Paracoccus sp. (in: a-proteobacteria)]
MEGPATLIPFHRWLMSQQEFIDGGACHDALDALAATATPLAAQEILPPAGVPQAAETGAALDSARSGLTAEGRGRGRPRPLTLTLGLTQPTPYRVALIDGPPRLVVDLKGVALPDPVPPLSGGELVRDLRWGRTDEGWSRLVVELKTPVRIVFAQIHRLGQPRLEIRLESVRPDDFAPRRDELTVLHGLPQPTLAAPDAAPDPRRLRVVIDPGHGGIDPGAQVGGISEAAVMLGFARDLGDALRAAGIDAVLTREDDSFVPLERRTTIARAKGADLFISLHADALPAGEAAGASIYVWNPDSNDRAAQQLAVRHDRDDLLAGLDLADTDENVTRALIDLARIETQPRSQDFAGHLIAQLNREGIGMHRTPMRGAAFSVLKSPDIPSVLLELGFLTDPADRANLFDLEWRTGVAQAIAAAVNAWAADEAQPSVPRRH